MKVNSGKIVLSSKTMEDILHNGLRVLYPISGANEGDSISIIEADGENYTGRTFFCIVTHTPALEVAQIKLRNMLEMIDDEGKIIRLPMTGEFESEKHSADKMDGVFLPVTGEKPVWLYWGEKWIQEILLTDISFPANCLAEFKKHIPVAPDFITLSINGQGGNKAVTYIRDGIT